MTGSLFRTLVVAAQLGLFYLVLDRRFQVESEVFVDIVRLALVGFLIHSLLPPRYRLRFFLLLSIAAILIVFGFVNGAWLIGVGLALIGICHLPVPFSFRVALLLAAGAFLAALRSSWLPAPWSSAIWPILGSMFMFRLIVYLYDMRHVKKPVSLWAVAADDGSELAEHTLAAAPVYDSFAASGGRLYFTTVDGRVVCYRGQREERGQGPGVRGQD